MPRDIRIIIDVRPDTGEPGLFWRHGNPWIRENDGREHYIPFAHHDRLVRDQLTAIVDAARASSTKKGTK